MRIENIEVVAAFTVLEAKALDPITVVLQDVAPGKGRLIIECYGRAWTAFWGAMGDSCIEEFVLDVNAEYIANRMGIPKETKSDKAYLLRIVQSVQAALRNKEAR
jgi:hypothetical protein